MRLYLVRHGKAEFGQDSDEARPLSERGRADIEALGAHLAGQDLPLKHIYHSGLVRARQTAEILAAHLAPDIHIEKLSGIEPWGDVSVFAKRAEQWTEPTMVCGHEPFMGAAVAHLVSGRSSDDIVEVKTGSVMALSPAKWGAHWILRWMLNPRIVRGPKAHEN